MTDFSGAMNLVSRTLRHRAIGRQRLRIMLLILTFLIPIHLRADCGVERLPVKVASDPDAGLINAGSVIPT
jgi:hypothetical protein